jgi:hypothetical protein
MILAFRHVPGAAHDDPASWALPYVLNDESELLPLPDGEYAIFTPAKSFVTERKSATVLPRGFSFDRIVRTQTQEGKMSVRTAK